MNLLIDGEIVDPACFSCGQPQKLDPNRPFVVVFDTGTPDTRITPGEPPLVFLYCKECAKEGGVL